MTLATQNQNAALAALQQQLDLTQIELDRCRSARTRLTATRSQLRKQLANSQLLLAKIREAAAIAGIDLSTVKLPPKLRGPRPRYGRRVLPSALRRPNRRKRAALRAAQRRREAAFRVSLREEERADRAEQRAALRRRNFGALIAVRKALPATMSGLEMINIYLPPDVMKRVRYAAIERDTFLRILNESIESDEQWPMDVLPIRGNSGVVAQVLSDYFAERDEMMAEREAARGAEL